MVLDGLDHPLSRKMEVGTNYLTKPKYSYKQGSISYFLSHSPQVVIAMVLIVLFGFLGPVCDLRYFKPTILAIFCSPRLALNLQFGYFAIRAKVVVSTDLISYGQAKNMFIVLIQGHIHQLSMMSYGVRWVGPPNFPKK